MKLLSHFRSADPVARFEAACPMPPAEIRRLQARRWVLDHVPKGGTGAEIGVFRGHFSEMICEIARPGLLYLVDPWSIDRETFGWGREYTDFGRLRTADARDEAIARTARHPRTRTIVIEDYYPACAARITHPLDFAYLDASHGQASTLRELERQIRPDGIILGDDWTHQRDHQHHGVFLAVAEFIRTAPWEVIQAGPGGQWAIRRRAATS